MLDVQTLSYEQFQYYTGLEKKHKEEMKAEAALKRKVGVKEKENEEKKEGMKEGVKMGVKGMKEGAKAGEKQVSVESAERPLKKKRY
jgi:hypothetical protein